VVIKWNLNLATGNSDIDSHHMELFRRFGNLIDACNQGKGKEEVCSLLQFLGVYVMTHFAAEEELMQRHNYPRYQAHREEHEGFIRDLNSLEEQLRQEGATIDLVIQTNQTMISWLINHISDTDKEMAMFLRS
jgi:hemerythrin